MGREVDSARPKNLNGFVKRDPLRGKGLSGGYRLRGGEGMCKVLCVCWGVGFSAGRGIT